MHGHGNIMNFLIKRMISFLPISDSTRAHFFLLKSKHKITMDRSYIHLCLIKYNILMKVKFIYLKNILFEIIEIGCVTN